MASLIACEAVDPVPESPSDGGANLLDVDGSELLPAEMCAPACSPAPYGPPLWVDSESLCYDGCNWCACTADGPMNCTARDCSALDAGDADGGL